MKGIDMSLHPERFQPHLFTLYPKMPWRFIDNLPVEWSHLICKCDRFNFVSYYDDKGRQPPKCGDCRKVWIGNFNLCGGCDQHYIRNFTHPSWCLYCDQLCWECIMASPVTKEGCCDANSWRRRRFFNEVVNEPNSNLVKLHIREPVGTYNPARVYSQDELYEIPDLTF